MGRYKLSWRSDEQRWRKRYKGKDYYFPAPEGKVASYRRCLADWHRLKIKIDAERERLTSDLVVGWWEIELEKAFQEKELAKANHDREAYRHACWKVRELIKRIESRYVPSTDDLGLPVDGKWALLPLDRDDQSRTTTFLVPLPPEPWEEDTTDDVLQSDDHSIAASIRQFLAVKDSQVKHNKLAAGTADFLRTCLERFRAWVGPGTPIEQLSAAKLAAYHKALETEIDSGSLSPAYCRAVLAAVKQFVRWAWELEKIELPRNLSSSSLTISTPAPTIQTFTVEEFCQLVDASSERMQLYLLLMANIGGTQIDISDLHPAEVDWIHGRLKRKRSKTRNHATAPVVEYVLWNRTFELLQKYRSDNPDHVLLNSRGGLLLSSKTKGNARIRNDNIRELYQKLAAKLQIPKEKRKPIKAIRKTSASILGSHPEFARYAQHFLGHVPTTIADKHYVKPSQERFDAAVTWLGNQFGF